MSAAPPWMFSAAQSRTAGAHGAAASGGAGEEVDVAGRAAVSPACFLGVELVLGAPLRCTFSACVAILVGGCLRGGSFGGISSAGPSLGPKGLLRTFSAAGTFQILFLNAKMMAGCPLANPFSYRRAHAPEMCVRSSGEGSSCQTQPAATRGVLSPIFRLLAPHRAGAGTYAAPGVLSTKGAVSRTARTDRPCWLEEGVRSARKKSLKTRINAL